ncbi:Gfo/Idh/MocA family protein [Actinomadura xylanilytica]|uniref:Gfo/Idh/MocA family protein n=1 Tax=Actinomadura xylanilytica TaxID=887459 RepID=UPI00255A9ABA|nr:Gfo/Idh/MocA family oxidoreductase [Actinomadura xylanilytica]MDL4776709.1 Gfo/Idh/MocA family oxidoreductase [Actinomadura xylanilytica]
MCERSLRFGVVGCADVAWRHVLPALAECPSARLVAVASRTEARARRFADRFGGEAVVGYERLLGRGDIDAVYIPLPTGMHAEWTGRALEAGKHVLVEKTLATSVREADELVALAGSHDLRLMENRMFVHHPQHETVRRLVSEGVIGELRVFTAAMAIPPRPADDIRYAPELGGGALMDVGFYPIHAAMAYLGAPLEVAGAVLHHDAARGVEIGGDVLLRGSDGAAAHLTFGFQHFYRSRYELWGGRGRIIVDRAFTPPKTWQPVVRIERQDREETLTLRPSNHYLNTLEVFVASVRGGGGDAGALEASVRGVALMESVRAITSGDLTPR